MTVDELWRWMMQASPSYGRDAVFVRDADGELRPVAAARIVHGVICVDVMPPRDDGDETP